MGMAGVVLYGVLWLEGANDMIAMHFADPAVHHDRDRPVRGVHRAGGGVLGTRRICIGLQRRDASMLTHGIETGIIVQLPNGGFEELERPPTEEEAALLIEHPPASVTQPPSDIDENGLPAPSRRGLLGQLQARAHDVFVEGISLAPPTNGHTNGHGGNGHNGHGEIEGGERAAVGAGQADPSDDETE